MRGLSRMAAATGTPLEDDIRPVLVPLPAALPPLPAALARALRRKHGGPLLPHMPPQKTGTLLMLPQPEPILFPGRWSKPEPSVFGYDAGSRPQGCCRHHNNPTASVEEHAEGARCDVGVGDVKCQEQVLQSNIPGTLDAAQAMTTASKAMTAAPENEARDLKRVPAHVLQKIGDWGKNLAKLWSAGDCDFAAEKEYNRLCSLKFPHCAVCSLLEPAATAAGESALAGAIPAESQPLIPESVFVARSSCDSGEPLHLQLTNVSETGQSLLLVCSRCSLCVHASCYGVLFPVPAAKAVWQCNRCMHTINDAVTCCLCSLRGGALKPTTSHGWAHIVCVLANVDTSFGNVRTREPIVVSQIPKDRKTLKCLYCSDAFPKSGSGGGCVQCTHSKACTTAFHVTCAKASCKVKFKPGTWPLSLHIVCARHAHVANERAQELVPLCIGDAVISKHQKSRCYEDCTVVEVTGIDYCCVHFTEDNTISNNLFRGDIIDPPFTETLPDQLQVGMKVNVMWTDGKEYAGKYIGSNRVTEYKVEFGDGSSVSVERDSLYLPNENLPKRVSRSSGKYNASAKENESAQPSKRQPKRSRRFCDD